MQVNNLEDQQRKLYLLLISIMIISFVLLIKDSIEMYNNIKNWEIGLLVISPIYETCLKWEFYTKTAFLCFSIYLYFSCICITILALGLERFEEKYLRTCKKFNYLVLGSYMFAFCFLGLVNWSNVVYECDKKNLGNKVL